MFIVIKDICDKGKSSLMKDNMRSEYFMCSMGVRQGDNLPPPSVCIIFKQFCTTHDKSVSWNKYC